MHGTLSPEKRQQGLLPVAPQGPPEEAALDLRAFLGVLRRHKWTIVVTFLGVVAAAVLLTAQLPKRYTATALVAVDSRDSQLLGFQSMIGEAAGGNSIVDTEVEIAQSPTIFGRAAAALGLAGAPDFAPWPPLLDMLRSLIGMGEAEAPPPANVAFGDLPEIDRQRIIERLAQMVDVSRRALTSIIAISATASSPGRSAEIANAIAEAYIAEQIEARLSSNERAATFLRDRVESLADAIVAGDAAVDAFVQAKLSELGSPQARDLLNRLADEAKQRQTTGVALTDVRNALASADAVRLAEIAEAQQAGLAAQRAALLGEATGTAPGAESARIRLAALDAEIRSLAERRANALEEEIALSNGRSAAFRRQIEATLSDLQLPQDVTAELFRLQRENEARRALYESSLEKLRQVEQQSDFRMPDSRVIAAAAPPARASFPPTMLIIAGAMGLGLILGVGLAFLREHYVGGVTGVEQFENLTGVPVVAAVPKRSAAEQRAGAAAEVAAEPFSAFSEAIRRIQLGVGALAGKQKLRIFITSPLPGDGKTTIAVALARQMAMTGASTLLIDADLRHPSVHRFLNAEVGDGLIGFLSGAGGGAESVAITTEPGGAASYILGASASAVATDALLLSPRFDDLMRFASEQYDVVIVDTPPIGLVVDAAIIARHCDIGVIVARYGVTGQHQLRAALRELGRLDMPLCGVLNAVEKADAYHYGGKRYRDYYRNG